MPKASVDISNVDTSDRKMAKESSSGNAEIYKILLGIALMVGSYALGYWRGKNSEAFI